MYVLAHVATKHLLERQVVFAEQNIGIGLELVWHWHWHGSFPALLYEKKSPELILSWLWLYFNRTPLWHTSRPPECLWIPASCSRARCGFFLNVAPKKLPDLIHNPFFSLLSRASNPTSFPSFVHPYCHVSFPSSLYLCIPLSLISQSFVSRSLYPFNPLLAWEAPPSELSQ